MRNSCRRIPSVAVLCILATVLLASVASAETHRWVVDMAEPFEVDGTLYPAGSLTLKHVRALNPSASLSEVWVGERCLGLLRADRVAGAPAPTGDALTFERDARGHLVLVGYTSPGHGVRGGFRFERHAAEAARLLAAK